MITKSNIVYKTDDLSIFKKLDGNRAITDGRVAKIKKSIETVGYISSPIIVNERYEIIDGQGRVEALKQLKLPAEFVVAKGAGLSECIALNINLSNWRITDYIDSYAHTGNVSYQYLHLLVAEYGSRFELHVIANAANGNVANSPEVIKKGRFKCTIRDYDEARKTLDYEAKFLPYLKNIPGRARFYLMAIGYCLSDGNVDAKRLLRQVKDRYAFLNPAPNMKVALEELEKVYNHGLRNKIYLYNDYQRFMSNTKAGYAERYMKKEKQ